MKGRREEGEGRDEGEKQRQKGKREGRGGRKEGNKCISISFWLVKVLTSFEL